MRRSLEEWERTTIAGRHAFEILADWRKDRAELLQEIENLKADLLDALQR